MAMHPERLPLGGSVLAPARRRTRFHPGAALLLGLLMSVLLWIAIAGSAWLKWVAH